MHFEIQKQSEIEIEEDPFRASRSTNKKENRSVTLTSQPQQTNVYPFGIIEEDTKSGGLRDKANRNSFAAQSSQNSLSDSSFISATDDPSAVQRQKLDEKLRVKKQKQAEKRFTKLKNMKNPALISKEFGELADMRASQPNLLISTIKPPKQGEQTRTLSRNETLKNIDQNYFNKHFAATPKVTATQMIDNELVPSTFKAVTRE